MRNNLIRLSFIFMLLLTLASCVDCQQCKEQCPECRSDTSAPAPPKEGTVMYMMNYKSVKDMVLAAPAECTDYWIVDIPAADRPDVPGEEFVLIPVGANRQPVPGNWMKGSRRCPPACDIGGLRQAAAEGNLTSMLALSSVSEETQRSFTDRIRQAPGDRNNAVTISRSLLAGLGGKPDGTLVITCPADGGTNLAVVSGFIVNNSNRTHVDL